MAECINGNCINGDGTFIFPDGKKYTGQFINSTPNGEGTLFLKGGSKISGFFFKGKIEEGKFTFPNGMKIIGRFNKDIFREASDDERIIIFQDGPATYISPEGKRFAVLIKDGKFSVSESTTTHYYSDGSTRKTTQKKAPSIPKIQNSSKWGKLIAIDEAMLRKEIDNSDYPVVINFYGIDGPSFMMNDLLDKLSRKYINIVKFCKLELQENSNLFSMYGITGLPMVILFYNGKIVYSYTGFSSGFEEKLQEEIDETIKSIPKTYE